MGNPFLKLLITLILCGICLGNAHAATLTSQLDRNEILLNETVSLTVSYDRQVATSDIDFSTLETHFEVLSINPSSNSSISIVNGKRSSKEETNWKLSLLAKEVGIFTIPSFRIGNDSSPPLQIRVKALAGDQSIEDLPLSVKVTTTKQSIYVAEQLVVEVELSAAVGVRDLNGSTLKVENAEVVVLSQKSFIRSTGGDNRQVAQLRFAVFPKEVGLLTIPALRYSGRKRGGSLFNSGPRVIASSKAFNIEVLAAPKTPWFVAENVEIDANWSRAIEGIRVGEPISRRILVRATGQRSEAIAELPLQHSSSNYKLYPDKPQLQSNVNPEGVVGERRVSLAIVATESGELTLPAIELPYWNSRNRKWAKAVLPATTISVLPALPSTSGAAIDTNTGAASSTDNRSIISNNLLLWLVGALLLFNLAQAWFIWRGKTVQESKPLVKNVGESRTWQNLYNIMKENRVDEIREALLNWASHCRHRSYFRLSQLTKDVAEAEFTQLIADLDRQLYSREGNYDNAALLIYLQSARKRWKSEERSGAQSKTVLPSFYPST